MDFTKLRNYLFLGILLSVTAMLLALLRPFAYPIFWAAVVAALFYPAFKRINHKIKNRNVSALITIGIVTIMILVPLTFASFLLVNESKDLYKTLTNNQNSIIAFVKSAGAYINSRPIFSDLPINSDTLVQKAAEASQAIATFSINVITTLTQNSLIFMVMFIIMLYTLFYFLKDGEEMLKKIMYLLPLGDRYEMMLYKKFTATAQAAIKSTLVIGVLQGALGGILFAVTGIPGAFIWSIIMMVLSVIPATSSFIVLFPAGVVMLLMGNVRSAILILVGAAFISIIDNFLRPILVGQDLHMHPIIILFSTLGGIAFFGVSGFVMGPIIAALFQSFWEMYEHHYREELTKN
jgi:predicted PurR-regulated permease PerM